MRNKILPGLVCLCLLLLLVAITRGNASSKPQLTEGELQARKSDGSTLGLCPLMHTDVQAEISGLIARVNVTQQFQNNFDELIEVVYRFPLPQNAAVDAMTMKVGKRIITGKILRRETAQEIYKKARDEGRVASLLDEERPNIFTQSLANIPPGEAIEITISYIQTLKYEGGAYEFVFPMVVAPRYDPQTLSGTTAEPSTDTSRLTPPLASAGARSGFDISLTVNLDAGVPIKSLDSPLQDIEVYRDNSHSAIVWLQNKTEIPNRDFVLRYAVAGDEIEDAIITHRDNPDGFFTLLLQPPARLHRPEVTSKELVFVLDTSGSMEGFPIEKAKACMKLALDNLYPQDTFNLITFAGDTHILFDQPVPATHENLAKAQAFLASRSGDGGTEMMTAIRAALDSSDYQPQVRIACFMTDGEVGNDLEIIAEVQRHPNARVFSFGIGNSVNRFLLEQMAAEGRGDVEFVTLEDDAAAAAQRFYERVHNPLMTDISIDWNGLPVSEVYPAQIPDLFSARPVVVCGRFTRGASGTLRLRGRVAGRETVREIKVNLPDQEPHNEALAQLWARSRIDYLARQDYAGLRSGSFKSEVREAITLLGLQYHLLTPFTSFVAVEEMVRNENGSSRLIDVPVNLPEGSSARGGRGVLGDGQGSESSGTEDFSLLGMIRIINPIWMWATMFLFITVLTLVALCIERALRYLFSGWQLRWVESEIAEALQNADLDEIIRRSKKHAATPLAEIMIGTFQTLQLNSNFSSNIETLCESARVRALASAGFKLKRGLWVVETLGWVILMAGFLATDFSIWDALMGMRSAEGTGISAVAGAFADAFTYALLGLFIAIPALWLRRVFQAKAERLYRELEQASHRLLQKLLSHQQAQIYKDEVTKTIAI